MKLTQTRWKIAAVLIFAALLAGCGRATALPSLEPTIDTAPTLSIIRTQAVETAVAEMTLNAPEPTPTTEFVTETAAPEPTATEAPVPTATVALPTLPPTVVPTLIPTSTFVPITATPNATITVSGYSCIVTESSPPSGYDLPPGGDFDGRWVIRNNGSVNWAATDLDVVFVSGTRLQADDVDALDVPAVNAGATHTVVIDMLAPREAGRYTTNWAVRRGNTTLCNLPVTIDVVP